MPVNSYMFDGSMTFSTGHHAVYAPYSDGLPFSDLTGPVEDGWETDGPMVRSAFQVRTGPPVRSGRHPVRDVWNDAQRAEFVANVTGHLLGGVHGDVLERAFQYWKDLDGHTGKLIEAIGATVVTVWGELAQSARHKGIRACSMLS